MKCIIQEKDLVMRQSIGEPKEIIVDSREWESNGHHGYTYSYHMSKERFERDNKKSYAVSVAWESEVPEGAKKEVRLGTIGYYDFVEFSYEDCIGERVLESAAKELKISVEEILNVVRPPLEKLQAQIRHEFSQTPEARVKKEHEEVIQKHQKAKRDFTMQFGFSSVDYDRCYNVFGQLMDAEYLGRLNQILEEREQMKNQSKRYRKSESQKRFHEYLHTSTSVEYTEQEQVLLSKFYKVLAKKYHPDANPGVDTSEEMTLLNKVKKNWGV